MRNAAASEQPASPATGWMNTRLNGDSSMMRPFITELNATPPARQRFLIPVSAARPRVRRSTTSSVTAWIEAARSMCRC